LSLPDRVANWDAAGFVLAGGQSRRMGRDKALVELVGKPLVAHVLDTLRAAGLNAAIAGARSDLSGYASVVADAEADRGPLSGICAALRSTAAECAVFVSVDLPLLPASLLEYMVAHARAARNVATIVSVNGFPQTFPAVVRRSALTALQNELAEGRGGCFAAFGAAAAQVSETIAVLPVENLVQAGQAVHPDGLPTARWFSNLNSQNEVDRISKYLGARHRVS
jgi:molybdopterin-guanine dinucleotide biosynthesis protein A